MCVVGIRKEIDLDVMNKGGRWITLSVTLNQIQGDSDAIEFFLPVNVLVNPYSSGILKVSSEYFIILKIKLSFLSFVCFF